jgi:integrase/recombinase XerD
MKVIEVVDAYLTRQRSLGMRFEGAGRMLHRFGRVIGNPDIDEVTPEAVAKFLHGEGTLSATWILKYRVLTGLYRFAVGRGYVCEAGCNVTPVASGLPPRRWSSP